MEAVHILNAKYFTTSKKQIKYFHEIWSLSLTSFEHIILSVVSTAMSDRILIKSH